MTYSTTVRNSLKSYLSSKHQMLLITVPHALDFEKKGFGNFWDRQIVWSFISSDNENDRRRKRAREGD